MKRSYYNKLREVPSYRFLYLVSPITKSTEPRDNEGRLEDWRTLVASQSHLIMRVLNRRLPCINYTESN